MLKRKNDDPAEIPEFGNRIMVAMLGIGVMVLLSLTGIGIWRWRTQPILPYYQIPTSVPQIVISTNPPPSYEGGAPSAYLPGDAHFILSTTTNELVGNVNGT